MTIVVETREDYKEFKNAYKWLINDGMLFIRDRSEVNVAAFPEGQWAGVWNKESVV